MFIQTAHVFENAKNSNVVFEMGYCVSVTRVTVDIGRDQGWNLTHGFWGIGGGGGAAEPTGK